MTYNGIIGAVALCVLGQPTLLPDVDIIGWQISETNEIICTSWEQIVDLKPACLECVDWYPKRWRVCRMPSIEELRSHSMPPHIGQQLQKMVAAGKEFHATAPDVRVVS
jgi:hypothetical protein